MEHKFEKARKFFSAVRRVVYLYKDFWREGTTALLHSPRSVDKTAEALTIAAEIAATGREVLYVNAEERVDRYNGIAAESDNLSIFTPEFESPDDETDYADLVFDGITQAVRNTEIRTFVIDSVNRIAALSFGKNASPAYIMKRLVAMQVKYKLSLLVLADETTKATTKSLLTLAAAEFTPTEEQQNAGQSGVGLYPGAAEEIQIFTPDDERMHRGASLQTDGNARNAEDNAHCTDVPSARSREYTQNDDVTCQRHVPTAEDDNDCDKPQVINQRSEPESRRERRLRRRRRKQQERRKKAMKIKENSLT